MLGPVTLRVGLVGAGPWAGMFHAPMLAAGPRTMLAAVWARRPEAAEELAASYDAQHATSYDDLLAACDAVAFAVPPPVQARLAPRAARAGKHLLLEKPLAFTLEEAEAIAAAVDTAGVQSLLMLRNRFTTEGRAFVARAREGAAVGALASFVSGASLPGSPFATPWRVEQGAMFDLAPHAIDLLDAALGPVVGISAVGDPLRWLGMTLEHEGGAVSQVALSITTPGDPSPFWIEARTEHGSVAFDGQRSDDDGAVQEAITTALAEAVASGTSHPLDVHRGVFLQRLMSEALAGLATRDRLSRGDA
jgi:predicted dehydrogenase